MKTVAIICSVLLGCMVINEGDFAADDLLELPAAQFEAYCALYPELPCGHVFMFDQVADNALGHVEKCILDREQDEHLWLAEEEHGVSIETPRHAGPCVWCCPTPTKKCGNGANAYDGCFCPKE